MPLSLLSAIQGLYHEDKYMVVDGHSVSERVSPNMGVKQGCPLSPLLFALYINDIGDVFKHMDFRTPEFNEGALRVADRLITHLLYADALTLMTATPGLVHSESLLI
jgi:hypothetical protein